MRWWSIIAIAGMIGCSSAAEPQAEEAPATEAQSSNEWEFSPEGEQILRQAIVGYLQQNGGVPIPTDDFRIAHFDLNADGDLEALAYLEHQRFCGSGGCNALILDQTNRGFWRVISHLTVTSVPIAVLRESTNGWRDIRVMAGGATTYAPRRLRFNGQIYPENPSRQPIADDSSWGEVVLLVDPET